MPSYFRQVPNFEYVSRDPNQRQISEYATVKNLFRRGKLRDDIFQNLSYFTKYQIVGDERPDNVAYKIYGDETLDWVILLSNNILNIQTEWPLPQTIFDKVMLEKYGSYEELYGGIHHYKTKEVRDSSNRIVLPEGMRITTNEWKSGQGFIGGYKTNGIISRMIYENDEVEITINQNLIDLKQNLQIEISNAVDSTLNRQFTIKSLIKEDIDGDGIIDQIRFKVDLVSNKLLTGTLDDRDSTCDSSTISCDIGSTVYDIEPPTSGNGIQLTITGNETIEFKSVDPLVLSNTYFYQYYDTNLEKEVLIPRESILEPVPNYQYEQELEDEKRNIFILKPRYLNVILNDLEEIMTYKKGSTQYVSRTLKKADNIRLYQ